MVTKEKILRKAGVFISVVLFASCKIMAQAQLPSAYSSNVPINYVRSWAAVKPDTLASNFSFGGYLQHSVVTTNYFDGLGRPLQTVIKQGSLVTGSNAVDMVSPVIYDEFSREKYKYLSFAANNTGGNTHISDGLFKVNPFQQDSAFNKGMFSDENWFYSQSNFETSPLNRVLETFGPGDNWVGSSVQSNEVNRHSVKMKYCVNTTSDSVRIWSVSDITNNFGSYTTSSMYSAGTLYKVITADETNNQVVEFKDKEGKIVLKKVQLTTVGDTGTGKGHYGWLCTYYIYDDLGQLRCVVQPRGVELLAATGWDMSYSSNVILNEQCFRYEYDSQGRMIMKKIPGVGPVWMVYDARDRLVLSQDSVLRASQQWLYIQYDPLNRPFATGIFTDNSNYNNLSYHSVRADTSSAYPAAGTYTIDTLTKTFYDDYDWRLTQGNPLSASRVTTYDNYLQTPSNTTWPYPQIATTQTNQLKGMMTGTKTKVLGTSTYLFTITFYDDKARPIQVQSTNIANGTDVTITQYNWNGHPSLTLIKNEKAGANNQTSVVITQITYDSLERILRTEKKISNSKVNGGAMPASWTIITQNEYDALGQLKKKKLGATPVDSLTYEYNLRGWMLGANRGYVKDTTSTTNWFGFDLGYDKTNFSVNATSHTYAAPQYNGNINGTLWRSTGDDILRKYDFTYDGVNRLKGADFNQLNSNSFNKADLTDFSVSNLSYDANGNILRMDQKGWKLGGSVTIDSLFYTYMSNSSKLLNVLDRKNDTATRLGDFKSSQAYMTSLSNNKTSETTDYTYDPNGNLTLDNNKDISFIRYNHLNLPDSIAVSGRGSIKYVYDADGIKLKKITTEGSNTTTTVYLFGNFVNDTLQFLPHEEGRVRFNRTEQTLNYDYFIKDHLGNVRMVLTEEQKTDMYPAATMETSSATTEETYYSNLATTRVDPPGGYPANTPTGNAKVAKVNGSGNKIGPAIILKVMAGDKFNLIVNSWWNGSSPGTPVSPLNDLINNLSINIANVSGGKATATDLTNSGVSNSAATSFLNSQNYDNNKPKAFINWIAVDEQFKYYNSSSGFDQVGSSNTYNTHTKTYLTINKSGYLYIYVSNETPNIDVFFDNLQITHIRGRLLEETHYYPFGLTIAALSSKAIAFGKPGNNYKFNEGTELNSDLAMDWYETMYRGYDAQIGRFHQIDPQSEMSDNWSPYAFVQNNPLLYNDPLGLDTTTTTVKGGKMVVKNNPDKGDVLKIVNKDGSSSYYVYDPDNPNANAQGYIGDGMESTGKEVVVTVKASKKRLTYNAVLKEVGKSPTFSPPPISSVIKPQIPEPLECGVGPKAIAGLRVVLENWSKATFRSKSASIRYHFQKHVVKKGINKTVEQYTDDAINYYKNNQALGKPVNNLKSGVPGILIKTKKGPGGYFTIFGEIVTFWYK